MQREINKRLIGKSRKFPQWWNDKDRNNPSQPVVGITWFEACAYCSWLSDITDSLFCLPSEAEWEASTVYSNKYRYPWGNYWADCLANTIESRLLRPSTVGVFSAEMHKEISIYSSKNENMLEDQSGNVWEWTNSLYKPYPNDWKSENILTDEKRTVRGGS